jgi:hypothetical protein
MTETLPGLIFNKEGQCVAGVGITCIICDNVLRAGLTGYICENPKCEAYLIPMHLRKKVIKRFDTGEYK